MGTLTISEALGLVALSWISGVVLGEAAKFVKRIFTDWTNW